MPDIFIVLKFAQKNLPKISIRKKSSETTSIVRHPV